MHPVLRRTLRARRLRPIMRPLVHRIVSRRPRSQIAFDFADPETERLFWEQIS
jgi:hypothetical protein